MKTVNAALLNSLNAPLPDDVRTLATRLTRDLPESVRQRNRHTLVVKRLPEAESTAFSDILADAPAMAARLGGLDTFTSETGPITYLTVESPGLLALHERLSAEIPTIEGIEGPDYVPHITLGRGGDADAVADFISRDVPAIEWTITDLVGWNATYREQVDRFRLGR